MPDSTISYVTTDLEFEGPTDLARVVAELEEETILHNDSRHDGVHQVSMGSAEDTSPEQSVAQYCALLERLSPEAQRAWRDCTRRVVDLAFESGETPHGVTFELSTELIRRTAALGLGVAITVYRVGCYSED